MSASAMRRHPGWMRLLLAIGPGLVVMLADTDAGSVITAAQSGAQWGYKLLGLQFVLIPVLYMVQELTIRLALGTGRGHGELIATHFGRFWARVSVACLVISCFGALVTEMSGLAGVGQMFGIPAWQTTGVTALAIFAMVLSASYRGVEKVAILLGLGELGFLAVAWAAHPDGGDMVRQNLHLPWDNRDFLYLVAANLGTTVMPWTVFYQQSALIDKGLDRSDLRAARLDTFGGAVVCQVVTAAVLVAAAVALGSGDVPSGLEDVPEIGRAFASLLGSGFGKLVFAAGLGGGSLVATIVVCLTAAWTMGEVTGRHHSLAEHPARAPWFYASFGVLIAAGAALVASGVDLVGLSIAVGVLNAILLPVVLGGLFVLARRTLPEGLRLGGLYALVVAVLFVVTGVLGLVSGVLGAFGGGG
jgi:Mn2+/Fe2+ NRAMP family transporter